MEEVCRKCTPKASPRPLFSFGKYPKQPISRELENIFG